MFAQKRKSEFEEDPAAKRPTPEMDEEDRKAWNEYLFAAVKAPSEGSEAKTKWGMGTLRIFQIRNGFCFIYFLSDDKHPARLEKKRFFGYRYDIVTSEMNEWIEKRSILTVENDEERFFHSHPIPDQMINALREVLNTYQATTVKLEYLVLDLKSLAKLEWVLADHEAAVLDLKDVKFDHMTDFHRKKLVSFVHASGFRHLETVGNDHMIYQGLLNEQFMIDIAATQLERFRCDAIPVTVYPHSFKPSPAILPALCNLHVFDAPSMVLRREWVVELIQNFLDGLPSLPFLDFTWRFAIDATFVPTLLDKKIKEPQFEAYVHDGYVLIFKKSNRYLAKLEFSTPLVNGGMTKMHIVNVKFSVHDG